MSGPAYPWQAEVWARLQQARELERLPHALLLVGPAGIGKRGFARHLSQALVCAAGPAQSPCGQCPACRQYAAGTYPDSLAIAPPEPGKSIPVDGIREMTERLGLSGQGTKVARFDSAEAMTTSAANSLLKTLEEPPGDAVLLLVSDRPGRLPATVRSRCQRVAFGLPPADQARQWLVEQGIADAERWLARAGGAPLLAQALAAEEGDSTEADAAEALLTTLERGRVPVGVTADNDSAAMAARVAMLISTVEDLIRLRLAEGAARVRHPEYHDRLAALAPRLDARMLFDYLDGLYRSMPAAGDSLRPSIQYQGLLADAAAIARPGAAS